MQSTDGDSATVHPDPDLTTELDEHPTPSEPTRSRSGPRPTSTRSASCKTAFDDIKQQLTRVIVGQDQVIEELLIALFSRGHCLLEGVPGLAKTLMIRTLAKCLSLDFSRIQFTPDLMPSDITGTEVIEENRTTGQPRVQVPRRARCSPTSSSPTRSTARRRRRRPRCSKRCRSGR